MIDAIAAHPGIFAARIADIVDCEVCDVMPEMEAAVKAGIVQHIRKYQPNGIMGDSFTLVGQVVDQVLQGKPTTTKAETILTYLKERGFATTHEIKKLLELTGTQHPTHYLKPQIASGAVHQDENGYWRLGADSTEVPIPAKRAYVKRTRDPAKKPGAVVHIAPEPAPEPDPVPEELEDEPEQAPAPRFACAIWSDGDLSLARDGESLAVLTPGEIHVLREYLNRFY